DVAMATMWWCGLKSLVSAGGGLTSGGWRATDGHAGRQRMGVEIRFAMKQLVRLHTCVGADSGGRSFLERWAKARTKEQVTGASEGGIDCLAGGWAIAGTAAKRTTTHAERRQRFQRDS